MINQQITDGRWTQVKCEILKAWRRLTDSEVEETNGDIAKLTGLVHQKYSESKEEISARIHSFVSRFGENEGPKTESQIRNETIAP
jgi:uncharacterized protein YjbJ (UPF0337 family)